MAKNEKWKADMERVELERKLKKISLRIESLSKGRDRAYTKYEEALQNNDKIGMEEALKEISFLKDVLKDSKTEYNEALDAIKKLDETLKTRSDKLFRAVEVTGAILLGAVGLGLAHEDSIKGHLKGKDEDGFFQSCWKKIFH